nr:paired amphipathic helix protein Sin3-like 1 isoform X2 [Ipomoea batatas]
MVSLFLSFFPSSNISLESLTIALLISNNFYTISFIVYLTVSFAFILQHQMDGEFNQLPDSSSSNHVVQQVSEVVTNEPMVETNPKKDVNLFFQLIVKGALGQNSSEYNKYIQLLEDYRENRIDIVQYVLKGKQLLYDYPDLFAGFNILTGVGDYALNPSRKCSVPKELLSRAIVLFDLLKSLQDRRYATLLMVYEEYQKGRICREEMLGEAKHVFLSHYGVAELAEEL